MHLFCNVMRYHLVVMVTTACVMTYGAPQEQPETTTGTRSEQLNDLVQHSVVLIKTKSSRKISVGSGFITEIDGKLRIVTNQHVIAGAKKIIITNSAGQILKPGGHFAVSPSQDLALMGFTIADSDDEGQPLELAVRTPRLREDILVLGDSGGQEVVSMSEGNVLGSGKSKLEIEADVTPGASGGPVLLSDSLQVCGVVVYAVPPDTSWLAEDTRFAKTRRFAERVPDDQDWSDIKWSVYQRQAARLLDCEQFIIDCGKTLTYFNEDIDLSHEIKLDRYTSRSLGRKALHFYKAVKAAYKAVVHGYQANELFTLRDAFTSLERDFEVIEDVLRQTDWPTRFLASEAEDMEQLLHVAERKRASWEMTTANIITERKSKKRMQRERRVRTIEVIMCSNPLCEHYNTKSPKPGYSERSSGRCPQCGKRASAYIYRR